MVSVIWSVTCAQRICTLGLFFHNVLAEYTICEIDDAILTDEHVSSARGQPKMCSLLYFYYLSALLWVQLWQTDVEQLKHL